MQNIRINFVDGMIRVISLEHEWIQADLLARLHVYTKYHHRVEKYDISFDDCAMTTDGHSISFAIKCKSVGISCRVIFEVEDKNLWVHIPYTDIHEANERQYILYGIELLPDFGGQPYGMDGYLLWPNYSGILCAFDKKFSSEIRDIIYSAQDRWEGFANMPLFGVKSADKAFLAIVTSGQYECELIHRLGMGPDLIHSTTPLLRFRMYPTQPVDDVDRIIRYTFFDNGDANYVAMAKAYRKYLLEYRKMKPLAEKIKTNPLLEYQSKAQWLKIFCASKDIQCDGCGDYHCYTTFKQAREILQALMMRGVKNINAMLVGWTPGGHDGSLPDHWPPDERLGGVEEMRRLVLWGKNQGLQVVVHDNYIEGVSHADSFREEYAMIGPEGYRQVVGVWGGGESYRFTPEAVLEVAKREMPRIKKELDMEGVYYIDATPLNLEPDYRPEKKINRRQYAEGQIELIGFAQKLYGACQVECGHDYIFDAADSTASILVYPWSLPCPILSETSTEVVPFFQIAWHGLVTYHFRDSKEYFKNLDQPWEGVLRELSWGALGRVELTYDKNVNFGNIHDTELLDFVARQYDLLNVEVGRLQYEFIEDYKDMGNGIYRTIYSDGTAIIVDYNTMTYEIVSRKDSSQNEAFFVSDEQVL